MKAYAEGTSVTVERSRAELDAILNRNGAKQTMIANDDEKCVAVIGFVINGAKFRLELPLPSYADTMPAKGKEPQRWWSMGEEARKSWRSSRFHQARRERWRAVLLLLKSKLEIVRIGLSSVEREFMADMVLPGGATAYEALSEALRSGLVTGERKMLGPPAPEAT
jgi:hypothetical protein